MPPSWLARGRGRSNSVAESRAAYRALVTRIAALLSIALSWQICWAVSPAELPPALRSLPLETLLRAFSVSWEPPNAAADLARQRAWLEPAIDDISACPRLARLLRDFPNTSDARRALLDIAGAYARAGDWEVAQAPFRYVMEIKDGQSEARIAHFRLVELYRYAGVTPPADPLEECRKAIAAYAGTPEEGLGRMMLGDMLAERDDYEGAFAEFERVLQGFPKQPYIADTRVRYSVALTAASQPDRAIEIVSPVLTDPLWRGRGHWARARAYAAQGEIGKAIVDYLVAAESADNLRIRGDCYQEAARLCDHQGNRSHAGEYLQACLEICPDHPERLQIRLDLARRFAGAGRLRSRGPGRAGVAYAGSAQHSPFGDRGF